MIRRKSFGILLVMAVVAMAAGAKAQGTQSSVSSSQSSGSSGFSGAAPAGGSFSGSVPTQPVPGVLPLSLQDTIDRGLKQNLGLLLSNSDIHSAAGQRWQQLAAILPHVSASPYIDVSQVNLAEFGFSFSAPGFTIPSIVGPFSYFDARANLSDSVFDWSAINNTHAASERLSAARHTYQDARDLVVLARLVQTVFHGVMGSWALNPAGTLRGTAEEIWGLLSPGLVSTAQERAARGKIRE